MKKIALLIIIMMVAFAGQAQKVKRTTAWNYLNDENFEKAIEYIEPTITHEKTMNDAKTWYYRALIYMNAYDKGDSTLIANHPDAIDKAYESLLKARELDEKESYKRDIDYNMQVVGQWIYAQAAESWNTAAKSRSTEDFNEAGKKFEKLFEVNANAGVYDTTAYKNAGLAYYYGQNYEKSKELFAELASKDIDDPTIYSSLFSLYLMEGDTATGEEYLNVGLKRFPTNNEMIISKINLDLARGNTEGIIASIETAIENDPDNDQLYSVAGTSFENIGEVDKALEYYKKALELDPENVQANYNLGAYYNNIASEYLDEANSLPLEETEKYEELKAKGEKYLKKAYPYLEKSYEIDPTDKTPLEALHKIYIILKMNDELKSVNERLKK